MEMHRGNVRRAAWRTSTVGGPLGRPLRCGAALAGGLIAALALAPGAGAATFCVGGPIPGVDCGPSTPPTIQLALDAADAAPGQDTVRIPRGTFTERVTDKQSLAPENATTIIGDGQYRTVIQNPSKGSTPTLRLHSNHLITGVSVLQRPGATTRIYGLDLVGATARWVTFERTDPTGLGVHAASWAPFVTALSDVQLLSIAGNRPVLVLQDAAALRATITSTSYVGVLMLAGNLINSSVTAGGLRGGGSLGQGAIVARRLGNVVQGSVVNSSSSGLAAVSANAGRYSGAVVAITDTTLVMNTQGAPPEPRAAAVSAVNLTGKHVAAATIRGVAATGFGQLACATTSPSARRASVNASYTVATTISLRHCEGGTGGHATSVAGPGLLLDDPQLLFGGSGPRLLVTSPAIDAGNPDPLPAGYPAVDFSGAARVQDGNGDGIASRDAGASEFTPLPPGTTSSVPPTIRLVSAKGTQQRVTTTGTRVFTVIKRRPPIVEPGTVLLIVKLQYLPATTPLTVTLERRFTSGGQAKYRALPGTTTVTATGPTLQLRPTGRWAGKALRVGTYRVTFTLPSGVGKAAQFRVVE